MIKQNIVWGIFILFVPTPWFWTVRNWDFLSDYYGYDNDDDNDDVNNHDNDEEEDNNNCHNTYDSTDWNFLLFCFPTKPHQVASAAPKWN